MDAIRAYLSRPSDLASALQLLGEVPAHTLLTLCHDAERNSQAVEAVDRALCDPEVLLRVLRTLGLEGVKEHSQHKDAQTLLFRRVDMLTAEQGLSLGEDFIEITTQALSNGETAVVEPVSKWLLSFSHTDFGISLLRSARLISVLRAGLHHPSDISRIRYCDLIVRLSVTSPVLFEAYSQAGLIGEFLEMYDTQDILLKLTLIEVVAIMGNSPQTIQALVGSAAGRVLTREMEDDSTDDYVRGQLLELFAKLYSATGEQSLLSGRYWQVLHSYLSSPDLGKLNKAFTAVCHIADRPEGAAAITARDTILRAWLETAKSSIAERRIGFYVSFAHVLQRCPSPAAQALFARLPVAPSGKSLLCKELTSPFAEFQHPVLTLTAAVTRFPWGVSAVFGEPELAEFLLSRNPRQNADICGLKFAIVESAHKSELPLTPLLRARIAEYVAGGVFAPAFGQVEEAITENIN